MTDEWFNFYNGYDPVFTWWMGMPYKQITTAYRDYAKFLREKVAAADEPAEATPAVAPAIQPAAAPKYGSVPDLNEIIGLPQDEMRDVVARFMAGGGGGGRGGVACRQAQDAAAAPDPRTVTSATGWRR